MTKNREIRLEDITHCDHSPELPISEDGEILYWICRCGRRVPTTPKKGSDEEAQGR